MSASFALLYLNDHLGQCRCQTPCSCYGTAHDRHLAIAEAPVIETLAATVYAQEKNEHAVLFGCLDGARLSHLTLLCGTPRRRRKIVLPFDLALSEPAEEQMLLEDFAASLCDHPNVRPGDLRQCFIIRPLTSQDDAAAAARVFGADEEAYFEQPGPTESPADVEDGVPMRGYNWLSAMKLTVAATIEVAERGYELEAAGTYVLYAQDGDPLGFIAASRSLSAEPRGRQGDLEIDLASRIEFIYVKPSLRGRGLGVLLSDWFARLLASDLEPIIASGHTLPVQVRPTLSADYVSFQGEKVCENLAEELDCRLELQEMGWTVPSHRRFKIESTDVDAGF